MAALMKVFVLVGRVLFSRLPFCSMMGASVGSFVGFLFGIVMIQEAAMTAALTLVQMVQIGVVLGFVGLLLILVFLGWLHYVLRYIALPALVNSLLTGVCTVIVNRAIQQPGIAAFIGMIVGMVIGAILCRFCSTPIATGVKESRA